MVALRKKNSFFSIVNFSLIDLPTPMNLSFMWGFGSLLGCCLGIQIISGLLLSMHYSGGVILSFDSVVYIMRDVNSGWLIRSFHANGASFFFVFIYLHVGRGFYYGSFKLIVTWVVGVFILFIVMGVAFMGYVLPWGQMSYWGATVITNLVSAVPYLGESLVWWIWGGFSVDDATLIRFYSFHFFLPFLGGSLVMVHLLFLHETGSSNPLGFNSSLDKISFHSFYTFKDLFGFIVFFFFLFFLVFQYPIILGDSENFYPANPLVTPTHIQPEWYFLFAYAILRSIPSKLGGVLALVFSISILFVIPLIKFVLIFSNSFFPLMRFFFWFLIIVVFLLSWLGASPVEVPYVGIGQILTFFYFFIYFFDSFLSSILEFLLF